MPDEDKSKIHSIESGKGTAIVLLHGFPFDNALWRKQLQGLEGDGMHLAALDLPGFGRSPALEEGEATMDAYADKLALWAREEGFERFALAGHSMGGYVAFAFARKYPEMLNGLVLICTRPGPDTDAAKEGRYKLIEAVKERGPQAVVDAMLPKLFAPDTAKRDDADVDETRQMMLHQSKEGIIAALTAMTERPDSTPNLSDIEVPTLIITGAEDVIIPAPEAEVMLSRIKDAKHVSIEGAGHMPMLEKPNATNKALEAFVRGL